MANGEIGLTQASALYRGRVTHTRLKPIRHRLGYRIFMLLLDLDELPALSKRLWAFGHNRAGLISFFDRDHGDGSPGTLKEQITRKSGIAGGKIYALCMPRVFGYVFNPLTVYFCTGEDDRVHTLVYEVNNTFGERHFYTLGVGEGEHIAQECDKAFRVSPFMEMDLRYRFNVDRPGDKIAVNIVASDDKGPMLTASFTGARRELSSATIMRELIAHPAMTLKVIAAIHWEAIFIWLKLRRAQKPKGAAHHTAANSP